MFYSNNHVVQPALQYFHRTPMGRLACMYPLRVFYVRLSFTTWCFLLYSSHLRLFKVSFLKMSGNNHLMTCFDSIPDNFWPVQKSCFPFSLKYNLPSWEQSQWWHWQWIFMILRAGETLGRGLGKPTADPRGYELSQITCLASEESCPTSTPKPC